MFEILTCLKTDVLCSNLYKEKFKWLHSLVSVMQYSNSKSVEKEAETYYGVTITEEEKLKDLSKEVENDIDINNSLEVNPNDIREGNIVKASFGSNTTKDYNLTLYRVSGIEKSKKSKYNNRKLCGIFLSPFSERAKDVMVKAVEKENGDKFITNKCYTIKNVDKLKEEIKDFEYGYNIKITKSNERKLGHIKILPDSYLCDYYNIDVEPKGLFSILKI